MSGLACVEVVVTPADPRATASQTSDLSNARRIELHEGENLRYCPGLSWLVWRGNGPWQVDDLAAQQRAERLGQWISREAALAASNAARASSTEAADGLRRHSAELLKWARQSEQSKQIDAALHLARPALALDIAQLNRDPWLLGCTDGVVDLRTGRFRQHRRADYITRLAGAEFDPLAAAPQFAGFLERIFAGDRELIRFMQRLCGYLATGRTDPHVLPIFYGSGANGKSLLCAILRHVLGAYAMAAPPGLLMQRKGDRHPTELADLFGARLVIAAESGEGGVLNEELVKMLSGGDTIKGRKMRQDFYEFQPTHKLILMTNHKPTIRGTDEGIWRRLLLIPFNVTIPPAERDSHLLDKLKTEAAGILQWIVEGAIEFAREGLQTPEAVAAATQAYRSESDLIGQFIADRCIISKLASCTARELFESFKDWCETIGERELSQRALGLRLRGRGFVSGHNRRGDYWDGLGLRADPAAADGWRGVS